jgi:hypothetical protein
MPIVDRSINTQEIIEKGLKDQEKKSYFYNQKKIGKFDPSKGSEEDQWNKLHPKTQDELDEEARQAQAQDNGKRERQAVADADLAAFNQGESEALAKRKGKSTKTFVRRGA